MTSGHIPLTHHEPVKDTAWLDGLRGIAAVCVVSFHWHHAAFVDVLAAYNAKSFNEDLDISYRQWFRLPIARLATSSGECMVSVFFIISGYVLTQRSIKHIRAGDLSSLISSLSSTMFRRAMRLWIPTAITSFVGLILVRLGMRKFDPFYTDPSTETTVQALRHWVSELNRQSTIFRFTTNFVLLSNRFEWVTWTIPLELYGSYACAITLLLVARVRNDLARRSLVAGLAVYALLNEAWFVSNFLAGMLIGDLALTQQPWDGLYYPLFGIALLLAPIPKESPYYTAAGYTFLYTLVPNTVIDRFWLSLGATLLCLSISNLDRVKALLTTRPVLFLGRISFSMYLLHIQVFDIIARTTIQAYFQPLFKINDARMLHWLHYFIFWTVMGPALLLLATWHTRIIDQSTLKLAKRVESYFIRTC